MQRLELVSAQIAVLVRVLKDNKLITENQLNEAMKNFIIEVKEEEVE